MAKLLETDIQYMLSELKVPKHLAAKLKVGSQGLDKLTPEEFDILHDLCCEKLQVLGFDENYELTEVGKKLEDLIDKLYEA